MKSILFILDRYPGIGGIEKVTTFLANYFIEKCSYKVSILSVYPEKDVERDSDLNKQIDIINLYHRKTQTIPNDALRINQIINEKKVTHAIYQDSYSNNLSLLYNINRKYTKIILSEHNTPNALIKDKIIEFKTVPISSFEILYRKLLFPFIYIKNYIEVKKHHKLAYSYSDKYIVLSNSFTDLLYKMIKDRRKIAYINNPITIGSIENVPSPKSNEILYVGRLTPQKGTDFVLKIWKEVSIIHPNWTLRIVGDGPDYEKMNMYVVKHNIKNVIFEGKQTDVTPFYKKAKIIMMTSRYEGWGLVLTEGMSYGCIPIAFNSYKAVYDIIEDEKDGFIINAFNIKEYTHKLNTLMVNENLIEKMSYNAFLKTKNYMIDKIGALWHNLIKSL